MTKNLAKKPKSKDNRLSEEEIRIIINSCEDEEEKFCILGLLYTGMRISEFIHMNKEWVNFGKGVIVIPEKQKCDCYECYAKGGFCKICGKKRPCGYWHPKTKSGSRVIPILPEVMPILKKVFSEYHSSMDYVFNRIRVWRILKLIAKRSKIRHSVFPHALRSTFASILAEKNFDVFTITSVMGWSKLSVAESYVRMSGSAVADKFKEKW